MSAPKINGRKASKDDFEILKKYVEYNHDVNSCRDNDFSRKEIISFFDCNHDGNLTDDDFVSGCFTVGGFDEVRNVLAKYGIKFGGYEASPKFDSKKALDPKIAILDFLKKSDYMFIGDSHLVNDEAFFIPIVDNLYKAGIKSLAIEVSTDQ